MKKRNLQPQQTAPVERPQAGSNSASRDPVAMFAAAGNMQPSKAFWLPI